MNRTGIEWADATWNPITGCTPISEGCKNCYAKRMANRLKGRYGYPADDPFKVTVHPVRLREPLLRLPPLRIFVCSMSDFFHDDVDPWWIDDVFDVCRVSPEHTYIFLTKRPQNISKKLEGCSEAQLGFMAKRAWIGVTAENQACADERTAELFKIQAAVRFVSVEPMLGPVDLISAGLRPEWKLASDDPPMQPLGTNIDWVICGGETGPGARPMHPDWVRSLRDQCQAAGVPFFFKGWGEWVAPSQYPFSVGGPDLENADRHVFDDAAEVYRVGKKSSGRLLDGREWNEFPTREGT